MTIGILAAAFTFVITFQLTVGQDSSPRVRDPRTGQLTGDLPAIASEKARRFNEDEALFRQELAQPKFDGMVNGIHITPDPKVYGENFFCRDPRTSSMVPGQETASDPMHIVPGYLPKEFQEETDYNVWVSWCGSEIVGISRNYSSADRTQVITISKFKGTNTYYAEVSQTRVQPASIAEKPAVFILPVGKNRPGQELVIVKTNYGLLVLESGDAPFEELVKVASGVK